MLKLKIIFHSLSPQSVVNMKCNLTINSQIALYTELIGSIVVDDTESELTIDFVAISGDFQLSSQLVTHYGITSYTNILKSIAIVVAYLKYKDFQI